MAFMKDEEYRDGRSKGLEDARKGIAKLSD